MAAPAGIPFGQYVLGKRLARGGMAEVFLARQRGVEGFDRRVAVKRILPHLADSREFIKMFLDEARYAARLAHPNIVHIYELGQYEESYFIAMEFVDGVHTGQLIKRSEADDTIAGNSYWVWADDLGCVVQLDPTHVVIATGLGGVPFTIECAASCAESSRSMRMSAAVRVNQRSLGAARRVSVMWLRPS